MIMRRKALFVTLLLTTPLISYANVSVSCKTANGVTQCNFTGKGSNLTALITQSLKQHPQNLVLNIETSNELQPFTISNASNITMQLSAGVTLKAPPKGDSSWKNNTSLILVENTTQFTLTGAGNTKSIIDGNGSIWWKNPLPRPVLLNFESGTGLTVTGVQLQNSPEYHIHIANSSNISIHDMSVLAPATSPSTDGVNAHSIQNMTIENIQVSNGDDGIAINTAAANQESNNIKINNITLTNGHGISIGSDVLGPVTNVTVTNVTEKNSQYGLRIKTSCAVANCSDTNSGSVSGITYQNITMTDVDYPIWWDLNYSGGAFSNVQISNVTYDNITATGANHSAILLCEKQNGCNNITFNGVNLNKGGECQGIDGGSYEKTVDCPFPSNYK